jgi:hypothetical protein
VDRAVRAQKRIIVLGRGRPERVARAQHEYEHEHEHERGGHGGREGNGRERGAKAAQNPEIELAELETIRAV